MYRESIFPTGPCSGYFKEYTFSWLDVHGKTINIHQITFYVILLVKIVRIQPKFNVILRVCFNQYISHFMLGVYQPLLRCERQILEIKSCKKSVSNSYIVLYCLHIHVNVNGKVLSTNLYNFYIVTKMWFILFLPSAISSISHSSLITK